jgi:DNA gyrase subunit B
MITAIGTGIGDEFSIGGARYHKVVLTCDADVDGAHIRTLILTFLFRHMRELIEAGYVYIAQPPLYKLRVGSEDRYFEKEHQLEEWLIRERLPKITILDRSDQSVKLNESRLQRFQRTLKEYEGWALKLIEQFGAPAVVYVKDHRVVEERIPDLDALETYFRERVPEEEPHRAEVMGRTDTGLRVKVTEKATGASRLTDFPLALFQSSGYGSLQATHARLVETIGAPPFTLTMNKVTETVHTFERFRPKLLSLAQEGLNLQRFKGLGEMNPEQLWETTMNPENRILQQVSVEDAAAADEVFSMLMGDKVEPRRAFIERNARDVTNLDV